MKLDRRTFLRGVLGGVPLAVRLPVLDGMLDGNGQAFAARGKAKLPLRFGVFTWGGGIVHKSWVPARTGFEWELPESLQPFGDLKEYVTLVTGTNHRDTSPGHIPSRGISLSSSHDLDTGTQGVGLYRGQRHPEPSVDVIVSEAWRGSGLFDSLEVGICRRGPYKSVSSWHRGGNRFNRHESSPQKLFDRLYRGEFTAAGVQASSVLSTSTALERSMLDVVVAEARTLGQRVGHNDRQRLEQHLESIRSIERRLQERERIRTGAAGLCKEPERPMAHDYGDDSIHEEKEEKSKVMSDLLAVAIACGMSRVFSYEFSANQSCAVFWEVGSKEEHHPLTHKEKHGGTELQKTILTVMKSYAYLARQLKAMREGDGNVLDRTLIFGTSEHANAGTHNYIDHPMLFVGKAGGGINAGLHYRDPQPAKNENAPKVLLSAVRAVGVPAARLGQETGGRRATEGIGAILA